jgi:hypothetical protein
MINRYLKVPWDNDTERIENKRITVVSNSKLQPTSGNVS